MTPQSMIKIAIVVWFTIANIPRCEYWFSLLLRF